MTTSELGPVTTEELFNRAVDVIRGLPKHGSFQPSTSLMLRFYGFYKQATLGPCQQSKPHFWDIVGRAKWDAWNKLGTMPKEEAMLQYIEELKKQIYDMVNQRQGETAIECARGLTPDEKAKIVETMAYTEDIDRFMDVLEPFYQYVDESDKTPEIEALMSGKGGTLSSVIKAKYNADKARGKVEMDNNSLQNGHDIRLTKESLSEKYFSDSDSENEEYVDPVEVLVDNIKIIKPGMLDHNDNDSGYADHIDLQNGSDHAWHVYSNGKTSDIRDTPSPQNMTLNDTHVVNNNSKFPVHENSVPALESKGFVARGGGEENGASSSPIGQRPGSQASDSRAQGRRGPPSQHNAGISPQRTLTAGGSGRGGPERGIMSHDDMSEQIAMALLRLQRDMDSVLARLNVLETVALAQHNTAQDRFVAQLNMQSSQLMNNSSKPSWWPFKDLSFRTFLFFLSWPVFLHFLIRFFVNRRARKHLRKL